MVSVIERIEFCRLAYGPFEAHGKNFVSLNDVGVFPPSGIVLLGVGLCFVLLVAFFGLLDLLLCDGGLLW